MTPPAPLLILTGIVATLLLAGLTRQALDRRGDAIIQVIVESVSASLTPGADSQPLFPGLAP